MKRNKWLYLALISALIIIGWIYYWVLNSSQTEIIPEKEKNISKKEYLHTFPEQFSKNDYFKWEFISNDIASIYPRREWLVRDILVDIWDEVQAGDTLAILFNSWVAWEAASKINIKNTIVSTKNNILDETIQVKNAKIAELDQKINEAEIILEETINSFNTKISLVWDIDTLWSEYQVELKSLENLKINLQNAELTQAQLISDSLNNIQQKEELLNTKMNEVYNKILPILYIWNEEDTDYNNINSYDFSDYFWATDSKITWEFIIKIKEYHKEKNTLNIDLKYTKLFEINNDLIKVLQNTITSLDIPEASIVSNISNINWYKTSLIIQKEILDDAKNMQKILWVNQNEKIQNIIVQIDTKENEIDLLQTKNWVISADQNLAVSKMKAEIDTLIKSKELLIANENKNIVSIENEISIAKADLNSESIKYWDYKIVSPFSWIVSKRSMQIGENISTNMEIFRLTNIETTLSRITKKEIKFLVPESLWKNIVMWKEIIFSIWNNESMSYTGSIYRISPEIDQLTSSIIVQAKVDENISLANQSTLRVSLETQQELYKIPSSTIYNKEERKIIYYKKDNWKLWVRDINIVSNDWEYSLITWNIDKNLQVVTTPIFIK